MKRAAKRLFWRTVASVVEPTLRLGSSGRPAQIQLLLRYRELAEKRSGLAVEDVGFNVYSATYEDGILLYIFSVIGMANKKCVDMGAGGIKGSNVANLITNHGFSGLLIDGNPGNTEVAQAYYLNHPETRLFPPRAITAVLTADNVNAILSENGFLGELDLVAIDIDGMDYWVWKALAVVNPRVVLVEYQDILGSERSWTVPYKGDFDARDYPQNRLANNYCGASLRAFARLGESKGYRLVGCSRGGWNAFFVRGGLGERNLPEVSVESCFAGSYQTERIEKRFPLVKDMKWQEV